MTGNDHRSISQAVVCCLSFIFGDIRRAEAQEDGALPGMTYEALRNLPDWSGWWGFGEPFSAEILRNPPPMRPEDLHRLRSVRSDIDGDADPARFCRPHEFVGFSGGFVESVEFLFTPGRVTLTNEMGLVRRIYTDGRQLPKEPDESNTGTSVGRWEGQTLVVETVGVHRNAKFPASTQPGAIPIGMNARVTERISLKDANTLEFDIVIIAPDILIKPDVRKRLYARLPKEAALEITFCTDSDRSIDPATGNQRFDMTPPADLAPPPSE